MRRSLTVLMLVAGLVAVSCSSAAAPTPQIVHVTPEPTTSTTPSPTIPLTMGEAQAAFQKIADDVDRAVNEAHGGFKDGLSLKALTAASCADLVDAMDAAKRAFETTAWPVDAQRHVPAIIARLDKARETASDPVICPSENDSIFTFYLFTGLQEPGDAFRRAIGLPPRDPEFYL